MPDLTNAAMYLGGLLLHVFLIAGTKASYSVLIANDKGIHIVEAGMGKSNGKNTTVLPYESGANAVAFHYQRGEVYGILKNVQEKEYRIFRSNITTPHKKCDQHLLPSWCPKSRDCIKSCSAGELLFTPVEVRQLRNCFKASNLVLDWINDNIYWTCDQHQSLKSSLNMATIEGDNNRTVLTRLSQIKSVDIDPFERTIYVLDSNTLLRLPLQGGEPTVIYQFDSRKAKPTKISVDTENNIIYIVGNAINEGDDQRYLARISYDKSKQDLVYKELYTSSDPGWQFGPKIVNSVLYWITKSQEEWVPADKTVEGGNVKMEKVRVPLQVNQWSLVHMDAQRPAGGSACSVHGCSDECSYSSWISVTCQCPPGMTLGEEGRTCRSPDVPEEKAPTLMAPVESSNEMLIHGTTQENKEPMGSVSSETSEEYRNQSTTEPTTVIQKPVPVATTESGSARLCANDSADLAESADQVSRNATETAAVTASSSSMALFYIVLTTTWVSIFVVVIVVGRRARKGRYQSANTGDRTTFAMS